ncbi:MAG: glycosyltransferase [Sedimenticola sp.]
MENMSLENKSSTLLLCPSVGIWQIKGGLFFDRKFHDGVLAYVNKWPGEVKLAIRTEDTPPPAFGLVPFCEANFPAKVTVLDSEETVDSKHLAGVDIVLASGDEYRNLHISKICKQQNIQCIYTIENIFETRIQIVSLSHDSLLKRLKSSVWLLLMERKRRQAFRRANGLQANGVAAYDQYSPLVPNTLLYFDTRSTETSLITDNVLSKRLDYLDKEEPLRLAFSGRLIGIKGADHLIDVAYILKTRQVPFAFDIFGAGDLVHTMQEKIDEYELGGKVIMHGNVDFSLELIPFIKSSVDMCVVCHRQSDPSCTYLETYACGVPIAGYANRAHQGILDRSDVGWSVPLGDVDALADLITRLDHQRDEIKVKSLNAALFSHAHTFENTFGRRIDHCLKTLKGNFS